MRGIFFVLYFIISFFCAETFAPSKCWSNSDEKLTYDEKDYYVQSLASLVFYTKQWNNAITNEAATGSIRFTSEQINNLWTQAQKSVCKFSKLKSPLQNFNIFEKAHEEYVNALNEEFLGNTAAVALSVKKVCQLLRVLWYDAIESEEEFQWSNLLRIQENEEFESMEHISERAKRLMRPHLISRSHPMLKNLDKIFRQVRATQDEKHFKDNGFISISIRPRSYVHVAKHPSLEGYLIKANLDNELRVKYRKESWEWFVQRCVGAKKLKDIIKNKKIKYFSVADKWIYPLPTVPAPPTSIRYKRHLCILLVKDMNLETDKRNMRAWRHAITKRHLEELYCCISNAKGASYRPDNISLTKSGQFAFIDTEYPNGGPDYNGIRQHLNSEMLAYWDHLVATGGNS